MNCNSKVIVIFHIADGTLCKVRTHVCWRLILVGSCYLAKLQFTALQSYRNGQFCGGTTYRRIWFCNEIIDL